MIHPLVRQLRFTRSEWLRALQDVTPEEAVRRFEPMNCISWMIGHLAWQEQRYWLQRAQNRTVAPALEELVGVGRPATSPPVDEMWNAWHTVTCEADPYLDGLTTEQLLTYYQVDGKLASSDIGTALQRVIYHYWYHIGESQAVRQLLGHRDLPQFVGEIQEEAPYLPEQAIST